MSAPIVAQNFIPNGHQPGQVHGAPRPSAEMQQLLARISFLRQNPTEARHPSELEVLVKQVQAYHHRAKASQMPMTNGFTATNGTTVAPTPIPSSHPPQSQSPVSFTNEQMGALRAQIQAFKSLSANQPVPEHILQAMKVPNTVITELETSLQPPDTPSRIVDAAVKASKGDVDGPATQPVSSSSEVHSPTVKAEEEFAPIDPADMPKGPFLEDDANSGIYPYNAYRHPFSHLKRGSSELEPPLFATRLQRLLVPTIMPAGLDAQQIMAERERYIEARIQNRIRELESLPSTMGFGGLGTGLDVDKALNGEKENTDSKNPPANELSLLPIPSTAAHGKLRAIIELKSLRLLEKQRTARAQVAERLTHGSLLPLNRVDFRRTRKPQMRDVRTTESLERKQRQDREKRAKHKHVEQIDVIVQHSAAVHEVNRSARDRGLRLGKLVLGYHAATEKEEQKRIERVAKERLRALKENDEAAYMGLLDTAKDTRITHLLKQTDSYLESLAKAVQAQQIAGGLHLIPSGDDEPTNEATFGARISEDAAPKGKLDYYSVAHRISEKITQQPSILVGGTLKEYQIKGLQWMVSLYNNGLNGILADEMGLGKTIQTISLISFLIETKRQPGPYLVIVPLSTMTNWSGEFAKWAPAIKVVSYKGNPTQRRVLQNDLRLGSFQVLLTTYEYVIKDRPHLARMPWLHMIIDEGHRMKNTQSKLTQTLNTYYHSRYRLILTGTPLQNNLPELWALLNFALPKVFNSVKSFDEWFNTPFANSGTGDKIELNEEEALLVIRRLHKVLRPFLLRRLKKDVESELPDKVEKVIKIRMSALQSQLYKQMKKHKMIADGSKDSKGKPSGVKGLSNELMQLRKICQHPFLFDSVEDRVNPGGMIDEKIIRAAGKFELLSRVLPKFFATGHRVLIFFQMTKVMDIMSDFFKYMGWKHLRLDGGTKTEERADFVKLFNAKGSEYQVFILSTRAGGLGLNLQTADTVIIFDSDWNPHADLQAQDRAHRIGQTKAVLILRFITEKSVEEAMYQRARYKLDIDDKVIQAGRFDNKSTQEEQEEFLRSILEADQDEDNEEAGDMNDEEMNELISRSADEVGIFRQMDLQRERDLVESWKSSGSRGKPPGQLMQLEELPECYRNDEPFQADDLADEVEGRGQRRRNIVSYADGLDDDTWAMALEDGEDIEELSTREKKKAAQSRLLREESNRSTPVSEGGRKRKGRPPKAESTANNKRKRGHTSISVTPSLGGEEEEDESRIQKRQKKVGNDPIPQDVRATMKRAFEECHKAVLTCEAEDGRKRCELFREVPDRRDYPDYYQLIKSPIALSVLRKRAQSAFYKDVQSWRNDWKLMFNNARTYNQEGSWVYNDAEEMEKVYNAACHRVFSTYGARLPGVAAAPSSSHAHHGAMDYEGALTPMDDEDLRLAPSRSRGRRQVVSDEEYMSDD